MTSIVAVFVGAGFAALLRSWLGLTLNSYFPTIPPGTLAANLIGGNIGVAVALFASFSGCAPECRYRNGLVGERLTESQFLNYKRTARQGGDNDERFISAILCARG